MSGLTITKDQSAQIEAFWLVRKGEGAICAEIDPEFGEGQVFVRTLYSGFNVDTERIVFIGHATEALGDALESPFRVGRFPSPVKYGESSVGVIERGPPHLIGRLVFCPYPHQSYYCVSQESVTVIPQGVSARRALLTVEMERAISALWQGAPRIGERIIIYGESTAAYLTAYLAQKMFGESVSLLAQSPLTFHVADALNLRALAAEEVELHSQDLVFFCASSEQSFSQASSFLCDHGRFIDFSYFIRDNVSLSVDADFLQRGLQLKLVHPRASIEPGHRLNYHERRRFALNLLSDMSLDCLISKEETPFVDLPQKLTRLCTLSGPLLYQPVIYPFQLEGL